MHHAPAVLGRSHLPAAAPASATLTRRGKLVVGTVFGVSVVAAWIAVTGASAQHELAVARSALLASRGALLRSDLPAARRSADIARSAAARARDDTDDLVWRVFGAVPWVGDPLRSARGVAASAAEVTRDVLPEVLDAGQSLAPARLREPGGRLDLAALQRAQPSLSKASTALAGVAHRLHQLPRSTFVPLIDNARRDFGRQVDSLARTLRNTELASRLMPPMLGSAGPRRYFLAFQTNAEARATGGLLGAFAILEAHAGKLRVAHLGSDNELGAFPKPVIDLGPEFTSRYAGFASAANEANSNISPHFPFAARIWAEMWRRRSGQRVDGVVATDPIALSYVLGAVGPVQLASGERITSDNVVDRTMRYAYVHYLDQTERKAYLIRVARAVVDRLLSAPSSTSAALLTALGRASGEGRLLIQSNTMVEQSLLENTPLSGALPTSDAPYAGVFMNNAAGNKLDYYLRRELSYSARGCHHSRRTSTVSVTMTNGVPDVPLPDIVVGRLDDRHGATRGTQRLLVSLFATAGAHLTSATLDDKPIGVTSDRERGHPVFTADVELPPRRPVTLAYQLDEPARTGPVIVPVQPLVLPMVVHVSAADC